MPYYLPLGVAQLVPGSGKSTEEAVVAAAAAVEEAEGEEEEAAVVEEVLTSWSSCSGVGLSGRPRVRNF